MAAMAENSVDAIITDPPYGLSQDPDIAEVLRHWLAGEFYEHGSAGFMGRGWDSFVPGPDYWHAAFRVLKPGGFLLAFSSTRTWDLLSMAIRFAGFENRDTIRFDGPPALGWTHGQGFPKGQNLAKAGAGEDWEGWNTTLKPAWEVILVFRKPPDGTVVANVKRWGVGGINVGGARVGFSKQVPGGLSLSSGVLFKSLRPVTSRGEGGHDPNLGRWPANWILSHLPGCEKVGTQRVKTETAYEPAKEVKRTVYRDTMSLGRQCGYAGEDGKEEVEKWECVEGCPVQALAALRGQRFQVQGRSGGGTGCGSGDPEFPLAVVPRR